MVQNRLYCQRESPHELHKQLSKHSIASWEDSNCDSHLLEKDSYLEETGTEKPWEFIQSSSPPDRGFSRQVQIIQACFDLRHHQNPDCPCRLWRRPLCEVQNVKSLAVTFSTVSTTARKKAPQSLSLHKIIKVTGATAMEHIKPRELQQGGVR